MSERINVTFECHVLCEDARECALFLLLSGFKGYVDTRNADSFLGWLRNEAPIDPER